MEDSQFNGKQHHKFVSLVIEEARKGDSNKVRVPLRRMAQIYDFMNLLKDEEEMEFVLEDITMELAEQMVVSESGDSLDGCGIEKLDYVGGKKDLVVTIDPQLKTVAKFRIAEYE